MYMSYTVHNYVGALTVHLLTWIQHVSLIAHLLSLLSPTFSVIYAISFIVCKIKLFRSGLLMRLSGLGLSGRYIMYI